MTVDVRAVTATALDPKDRQGDAILVVRWQEPIATELERLNAFNADAAISVATAHRYGLVHYHRAFRCDGSKVAIEFTSTFPELGGRTYVRKLRGLEIAASTHLRAVMG